MAYGGRNAIGAKLSFLRRPRQGPTVSSPSADGFQPVDRGDVKRPNPNGVDSSAGVETALSRVTLNRQLTRRGGTTDR